MGKLSPEAITLLNCAEGKFLGGEVIVRTISDRKSVRKNPPSLKNYRKFMPSIEKETGQYEEALSFVHEGNLDNAQIKNIAEEHINRNSSCKLLAKVSIDKLNIVYKANPSDRNYCFQVKVDHDPFEHHTSVTPVSSDPSIQHAVACVLILCVKEDGFVSFI